MEIQGKPVSSRFFGNFYPRIVGRKGAGCSSHFILLASALLLCLLLFPQPVQAQPRIRDISFEGTEATFEYDNAGSGQLYGVEVSNDLVTWVIFTERTSTDDGVVSFSLDLQILGGSISYFFRLVQLDPNGNPLAIDVGEVPGAPKGVNSQ